VVVVVVVVTLLSVRVRAAFRRHVVVGFATTGTGRLTEDGVNFLAWCRWIGNAVKAKDAVMFANDRRITA